MTPDSTPAPCGRRLAGRWSSLPLPTAVDLVGRIRADFGLTALVGLEIEFYLVGGTPESRRAVAQQAGEPLRARLPAAPRIQPESGHGQYELVFPHRAEIAELLRDCGLALEVLESCARAGGTAVSLQSKPFADRPGSGLHVNVCLLDSTEHNVFQKPPGSAAETAAMAHAVNGLLETMVGLMVHFAPTENCYQRYRPVGPADRLFSPSNVSWGGDNRSAAIRIPASSSRPWDRHIEHRVSGAAADPASAIAAVMLGVHHGLTVGRPPTLPKLYGIAARRNDEMPALPRNLAQAHACHPTDEVLRQYASDRHAQLAVTE